MLERAIELLINHGIEEIVINVHHLPDQIKDFINNTILAADAMVGPNRTGVLQPEQIGMAIAMKLDDLQGQYGDAFLSELGKMNDVMRFIHGDDADVMTMIIIMIIVAAAVVIVVLGVVVVAVAADDASRRVASVRTVLVLPAMPWPMVTALAVSDLSEALESWM